MTIEANLWNKNNSSWREAKDSASVAIDVSVNHEVSFNVTGVPGVGSGETGIIVQTSSGNFEARTLTGTANEITVTNGNGVSGNPTVSIPTAVTFTGKTITGGTYVSVVSDTYIAGTTAIAPVNLTSGTNLTTAAAGAYEYDGKALYFTSVASSRQVVNAEQFTSIISDTAGSNVNTAQNIFGTTEDVLTVAASTSYAFEAVYFITRAAGTTSHTTSILFGGSATFTSIGYLAAVSNVAGTPPTVTLTNAQHTWSTTAAGVTVIAASTSATENLLIKLRGILRIANAGTIIPQFQYSVAPGGAPTFRANSFFRCWPIGSNTIAAVGNWA